MLLYYSLNAVTMCSTLLQAAVLSLLCHWVSNQQLLYMLYIYKVITKLRYVSVLHCCSMRRNLSNSATEYAVQLAVHSKRYLHLYVHQLRWLAEPAESNRYCCYLYEHILCNTVACHWIQVVEHAVSKLKVDINAAHLYSHMRSSLALLPSMSYELVEPLMKHMREVCSIPLAVVLS